MKQLTKYGYDPNGNVISDLAPGISAISYDWRNRPTQMVAGTASYQYRYDASGQRMYRKVQPSSGGSQIEYTLPGMVLLPSGAIKRIEISDGYAEITQNGSLNRNYILRDWLGTPRVTLDGSGTVVQGVVIATHRH